MIYVTPYLGFEMYEELLAMTKVYHDIGKKKEQEDDKDDEDEE